MAATPSSSLFFLRSSLSFSSTTKKTVVPTKIAIFPILPEKPCVLFKKKKSSFVRNVVTTSEFDQEAGLYVSERRSGSEDLKFFVGNLSFGIDRADLTKLFGQVGTVELVEVYLNKIKFSAVENYKQRPFIYWDFGKGYKEWIFSRRNIKLMFIF